MAFARYLRIALCLCSTACFLFHPVLCQPATITSAISTNSNNANIIYPTDRPTLNNVDALEVDYDTPWQFANFTLRCKTNEQTDQWSFYRAPSVEPNGTYILKPVQKGMNIPQFPVFCQIRLVNANDANQTRLAGGFTMSSRAGVTATTYARQSTGTASTSQMGQSTASGDSTGTEIGSSSSPTARPTGASSSAAAGGMSSGAAIGLGVGVALGVLAVAAIVFVAWRVRRSKRRGMQTIYMPAVSYEPNSQDIRKGRESTYRLADDNFAFAHAPPPSQELDSQMMPLGISRPVELPASPASYVRLDRY